MDENRKAFEAYVAGPKFGLPAELIRIDPETGEYNDGQTQDFWLVWKASREAAAVELPVTHLTGAIGIATRQAFEKCRRAIHASGIRTK